MLTSTPKHQGVNSMPEEVGRAFKGTMEPIVTQAVLRMLIDRLASYSDDPAEERDAMHREVRDWINGITGRDNMIQRGLNDAGIACVEDIFAENVSDPPPSGDN
jgi:hypothetical protein